MPAGRQVKRPVGWSGGLKYRSAERRLRTRALGVKNREAAASMLKRQRQWKCDVASFYAHQPCAEKSAACVGWMRRHWALRRTYPSSPPTGLRRDTRSRVLRCCNNSSSPSMVLNHISSAVW